MVCRTAYLIDALLGAFGSKGGLLLAAGPKDAGRKGLRSFTSLYAAPGEKRADGVGWPNRPLLPAPACCTRPSGPWKAGSVSRQGLLHPQARPSVRHAGS